LQATPQHLLQGSGFGGADAVLPTDAHCHEVSTDDAEFQTSKPTLSCNPPDAITMNWRLRTNDKLIVHDCLPTACWLPLQ